MNVKAPQGNNRTTNENINALGSQIVREIVIPELTKEVNEDKNFAQLRQVYNSLILATWYKKKIKDSILAQVYADKNKIEGIGYSKASIRRRSHLPTLPPSLQKRRLQLYQRRTGLSTQETIPRKYFSGGARFNMAMLTITHDAASLAGVDTTHAMEVSADIMPHSQYLRGASGFNKGTFTPLGLPEEERAREIADTIRRLDAVAMKLPSFSSHISLRNNTYPHLEIKLNHLAQKVPEEAQWLRNREIAIFYDGDSGRVPTLPHNVFWFVPEAGKYITIDLKNKDLQETQLLDELFSLLKGDEFDEDMTFGDTSEELDSKDWDKWQQVVMSVARDAYAQHIHPAVIAAAVSLVEAQLERERDGHNPGKRIKMVDIFGGDGDFLRAFQKALQNRFSAIGLPVPDIEYWLIEKNQKSVETAKNKKLISEINIVQADLTQSQLRDFVSDADIVTSIGGGFNQQVIGPKEKSVQILRDVRKALAPGGHLIVAGLTSVKLTSGEFEAEGFKALNYSIPINFVKVLHGEQLYVFERIDDTQKRISGGKVSVKRVFLRRTALLP